MDRRTPSLPQWLEDEYQRIVSMSGRAKLDAMWTVALRLRDYQDVDSHIEWLKRLMRFASENARLDFTLLGFGELRRLYTTDPRYVDLRKNVLWYFKWLLEELPEHADVPLDKIEEIFRDAEDFYTQHKESLRPLYLIRCQAAVYMGQKERAQEYFEKWQDAPKGNSDDCAACELDRRIVYLLDREEREEALREAVPVLNGEVWCHESSNTVARVISMIATGKRREFAYRILRATQKFTRKEPRLLYALGAQVMYMSLIAGRFQRSRRLGAICLHYAREASNDLDRFSAYRAVGMWAALAVLAGQHQLSLSSSLFPRDTTATALEMPALAAACFEQASQIAQRFDARNGNDRYAQRMKEMEQAIHKAAEQIEKLNQQGRIRQ